VHSDAILFRKASIACSAEAILARTTSSLSLLIDVPELRFKVRTSNLQITYRPPPITAFGRIKVSPSLPLSLSLSHTLSLSLFSFYLSLWAGGHAHGLDVFCSTSTAGKNRSLHSLNEVLLLEPWVPGVVAAPKVEVEAVGVEAARELEPEACAGSSRIMDLAISEWWLKA
jgi:hypothetical protein